jgi:cysteine desulfurase/selenocysteine lyase
MTTSDGSPGASPFAGEDFTQQIAELANALFATPPLSPSEASPALAGGVPAVPSTPSAGFAPAVPGAPSLIGPPRVGPNAAQVGAGGLSTAATLPPIPGQLHTPSLAASPPPKDSDLRSALTFGGEQLGLPSTALSQTPTDGGFPPSAFGQGLPSPFGVPPVFGAGSLPTAGVPGAPSAMPGGAPSFSGGMPAAPSIPASGSVPTLGSAPSVPTEGGGLPAFLDAFRPDVVPDLRRSPSLFDPYSIKRDFPILEERVHGKPLVWLDNAATTQKPEAVIERLSYFYRHENSNVHRAAHALAARSTDAYEGARDKVRRFLNAPSTENIVFTRGATEAINLVAQSWGRRNLVAGDEIVITWLEHHANIVPWQQLATEKGVVLRVAPVDDRGQVILEAYERLLGPRTKLVAITQVSNALGTIVPVTEMTQIAHRYGACVLVDGAQTVSHQRVDVQAIDSEFYVFSGHKVFGPTGIGVLYGKLPILEAMPPWQGGGNMISDVRFERTTYQRPPWRFEAGTGNIADAVGLGAAIDYVSAIGMENIARYEHELLEYATEHLLAIPGLTMIGTAPDKAGVLSFVLAGLRTEDIGAALDQEGIAVRSGHHCAQPILRRFGLESTVRASLAPYNTREDIDALVRALLRIRAKTPAAPL